MSTRYINLILRPLSRYVHIHDDLNLYVDKDNYYSKPFVVVIYQKKVYWTLKNMHLRMTNHR